MSWVCYLLECADGTLYCGVTNDLDRRLAAHNSGSGARYTRSRTPLRLAYAENCADKSAALRRELQIKRMARHEKLRLCGVSAAAENP
jgi:putative endonuclease